jgi:hypothetical protein
MDVHRVAVRGVRNYPFASFETFWVPSTASRHKKGLQISENTESRSPAGYFIRGWVHAGLDTLKTSWLAPKNQFHQFQQLLAICVRM